MPLKAFKILCLSAVPQNIFVLFRMLYLCGNVFNTKGRAKLKFFSQKIPILDPDLNIGSFILFLSFTCISFMDYVWTRVLGTA